ncbi:hypothetical protein [Aurantiacibacter sediminis]|uniref:Uncharacterized protein n=1 Tax=Aurantiacibacter sediminis TaxID=2793064 RepID=A0ABS0MZL0_9SPHN|nr:hypothetical protein [Aurantiacibacter sediminis]MBH5321142.1 hypothetical protein [Aurantiacibacter sediminis]
MTKLFATAAAGVALAISAPALAQDRDERMQQRSDEAFAELVEDRERSGEAQTCISIFNSNRLQVVEHVGLAYRRGDTLWVARTTEPDAIGPWDVPIIERYGSQLCRNDVTRLIDRSSGVFSGVVFFEDWVPYTEVDSAEG